MRYYEFRLLELEEQLQDQEKNIDEVFEICNSGIRACQDMLKEFRIKIVKQGFPSPEVEIAFFKTIKPKIMAHIIFYINRNQIESKNLFVGTKMHRKFLMGRLKKLELYFKENAEFYDYNLRGLTHLDREYFTRQQSIYKMHYDSLAAIADTHFSTSYDMVLAKIIGYNRTITFLQQELQNDNYLSGNNRKLPKSQNLNWTGSKADLVELIYALQASGMVNNGSVAIKELALGIEHLFSIDLGDYYRIFLEIRSRKSNPSKLLDTLKTSLLNKIIAADA